MVYRTDRYRSCTRYDSCQPNTRGFDHVCRLSIYFRTSWIQKGDLYPAMVLMGFMVVCSVAFSPFLSAAGA